jgi:AbrB family looped-hinge helix DNA binding protein
MKATTTVLKVTSKGQVTLRKNIMAHLGIAPGDKIDLETMPDGRVEMKATRKTVKFLDLFGMLKQENGPVLTIEDMNEIIRKGWAGEL